MSYQFTTTISREAFDQFVSTCSMKTIFQTSQWATIKKEWEPLFTAVTKNDEIVAASLVLIRKLPLGYTLFYLPRGPVLDYSNTELLSFYFNHLKKTAKKRRAISIKIDPNILLSSTPIKEPIEEVRTSFELDQLEKLGFKHFGFNKDLYSSSQPRYSACLYYQEDFEAQAKGMKAQREIKKAKKKGLEIQRLSYEQLDIFSELMKKTEQRKGVALRSLEYFQRIYQAFQDDCYVIISTLNQKERLEEAQELFEQLETAINQQKLAGTRLNQAVDQRNSLEKEIAFLEEKIKEYGDTAAISGLLAVRDSKTCELLYAGMNDEYKKYYGTYYTYFSGIEWGQQSGCEVCNFGGIPGTLDDGLTEFKSFFSPNVDEYIGEFDLPVNKIVYPIFTSLLPSVKKLRKKLRGNKNK